MRSKMLKADREATECGYAIAAGGSIPVDTVAQPIVVSLTPGMGRATGIATL